MSNEYLKQLSKELKDTREKKKITIDQIFTKTRIYKKYLIAIEDGNFSIMPEVYIRAFIKEYAKTIGLDPIDVLSKFDKAKEGLNYEKSKDELESEVLVSTEKIKSKISQAADHDSSLNIPQKFQQSNKMVYFAGLAVLLLLSIFIIYKVFLIDSSTEIITEKPFDEIVESQNQKNKSGNIEGNKLDEDKNVDVNKINLKQIEKIKENKSNEINSVSQKFIPQPIKEGQLTLTIIGNDKSWVRVVSDQKDNVEFMLNSGVTKQLTAKNKFYLHIGNSGGVKLLLNNNDLFFRGSPGKVRKIFITKDGIEYLRRTPNLNAN